MPTLIPTVTLPSGLSVDQAGEVLSAYRPDTRVAIRHGHHRRTTWHVYTVGELRDLLAGLTAGDASLADALQLDGAPAVPVRDAGDPAARLAAFEGLVVSGREAVGLTFEPAERRPSPTRSWRAPGGGSAVGAPHPPMSGAPSPPAAPPAPSSPAAPPPPMAPPPAAVPPPPPMAPSPPAGPTRPPRAPVPTRSAGSRRPAEPADDVPPVAPEPAVTSVHPRLDAPEEVHTSERFDVIVGVAPTAQPGLAGGPMRIVGDDPVVELTVQLTADGFELPDGIRAPLRFRRGEEAAVAIPVVAPDHETVGRLEVTYVHRGVPIGRAWREVRVDVVGDLEPSLDTGSLPMALGTSDGPDLTVVITDGNAPGRYLWTFASPHEVDLPDHQVVGPVIADPRSFALRHVKDLARADGSQLASQTLAGISRIVSRAAPNELWQVLDAVWRTVGAGTPPSVLLISDDRYIPWELASTEEDWVDPALLSSDAPLMLGAQVRLGRWLPAGPATPRGVSRPAVPPDASLTVDRFALVVGDYLAELGQRPLPMAKEEGDRLGAAYPHVRLGATADAMQALLADQLTLEGKPVDVQVIHFACHGEVDPNNPAYNGIVLSDTTLRLDQLAVAGSTIGRNDRPLVFLNACQLAHDTGDLLGDYGGLAGAFLIEGCRAFVAALWSVNDVAARDIAIDFYRMTIGEGLTAGEALRRIRARGLTGPTITPFAYVYYGHPDLQLRLSGPGLVVDIRREDHADAGRN